MIKLTQQQLKELQSIELEMLKEVDRICRKYNIQYSLDGGTLLGAIRHDGFIPWDDDADIVMLRSEYEKFYCVCQNELDTEKFFLQDFRTDENYRWGYAKIRRKGTLFLRKGQEHVNCNQGIFADIFICDNVPDGYLRRRWHWFKCFLIRKGLYSEVGKKKETNLLTHMIYDLLSRISRDFWVLWIERIARKGNVQHTELVGHMTYPYPKACQYGMPSSCFQEYIEKDFEGHSFKIFKDYDLYMKLLYGDYMQLPPEEKRKIHPVSALKLLSEGE